MLEKHLYEFAVIRLVPRVEREEFLNVGVLVFCKRQKYLRTIIKINELKLQTIAASSDVSELQNGVQAFENIVLGKKECGPIALLDCAERFRWLTAVRSSSVQTSRPHPGLSIDLEATLQHLFEEMVL
jgi:hypothetical protein